MQLPPQDDPFQQPDQGDMYPQSQTSLGGRLLGIITFKQNIYREIAKDRSSIGIAAALVIVITLSSGFVGGYLNGLAFQSAAYQAEIRQMWQEMFQQFEQTGMQMQAEMEQMIDSMLAPLNWGPWVWGGINGGVSLLAGLFFWLLTGWLSALAANKFFEGNTSTGQILSVFGFVYIFSLIGLLPVPCVAALLALGLSIVGNTIGIKAAAGIDTGSALVSLLFAYGITLVVVGLIFCCPLLALLVL